MIPLHIFSNRPVAVFGLARSGIATARALAEAGALVLAWDDSEPARIRAAASGVTLSDLYAIDWRKVAALLFSPGIPLTHPTPHPVAVAARANGCEVICDIELLGRACPDAVLAGITGTNGKSTTTALLAHILKQAGLPSEVGGNLGYPVLDLEPLGADGTYVLELSSYQLDLITTLRFRLGMLLNISPDHLDRHGGMDGYIKAKLRLFERQGAGDVAVIGIDDEASRRICENLKAQGGARVVPISSGLPAPGGVSVIDGLLIDDMDGALAPVLDLKPIATLPGSHNWQNAAAAFAGARALGLAAEIIAAGIQTYPGLAHRQERIASVEGIVYVNDSKATNADATARALVCYEPIYWIAGGKPKEGGIKDLAPWFGRIRHAFLIGEAAPDFAATLDGRLAFSHCGDLANAVAAARAMAEADKLPGAVVLLSPACASFDQYQSFEHRGEHFRDLVLGGGVAA